MRTTVGLWRALLRRVGRRGAALLFFAFLDLVYSVSMFNPPREALRSPTLLFVDSILPLWAWGVLWGITGLICLIHAFRINDKIGFTAAITLKTLWGSIFVYAAAAGLIDRAYVSAAIWLSLAGWVGIIATWPEPTVRPADEPAVTAPDPEPGE